MIMTGALISPAAGGVMWALSAGAAAYAAGKTKMDGKKLPVMACAAAFVFAAQLIKFIIPAANSSAHILGGVLLAALLGSAPGFLVMAAVIFAQTLVFAEGGLPVCGCNLFNMGAVPCLLVYPLVFKPLVKGFKPASIAAAASAAAVISALLGASAAALETLLSGITVLPPGTLLLFTLPVNFAISIVEALITSALLILVHKTRPEILEAGVSGARLGRGVSVKKPALFLAAAALVMLGFSLLFAAAFPGGFALPVSAALKSGEEAGAALYGGAGAPDADEAPDYNLLAAEAEESPALGNTLAGILGVLIIFALGGLLGFIMSMVKKKKGGNKPVM